MHYDLGMITGSGPRRFRANNKTCLPVRTKSLGSFFIVFLSYLLSPHALTHPSRPFFFAFAQQFEGAPFFLLRPSPIKPKRAVGLTLRPLIVNADPNPLCSCVPSLFNFTSSHHSGIFSSRHSPTHRSEFDVPSAWLHSLGYLYALPAAAITPRILNSHLQVSVPGSHDAGPPTQDVSWDDVREVL